MYHLMFFPIVFPAFLTLRPFGHAYERFCPSLFSAVSCLGSHGNLPIRNLSTGNKKKEKKKRKLCYFLFRFRFYWLFLSKFVNRSRSTFSFLFIYLFIYIYFSSCTFDLIVFECVVLIVCSIWDLVFCCSVCNLYERNIR